MSAVLPPHQPDISLDVQQVNRTKAGTSNQQLHSRSLGLVLLCCGLLCFIQALLNIALRLAPMGSSQQERKNWDDSRRHCRQEEADLVIINSRAEQAFLSGLTASAWVGMTDRDQEGTWLWVDGTAVSYDGLLWAPGQPDDSLGGEDCGELRKMTGFNGLNDYGCNTMNVWICEKPL
ncbi:C-type lectin domain family 4 member M-like isoform X2 [Gouania willdenowi]|uniref:C-type lectin domain family 4 member M-like isoform X2 n=1 Tax=Gouania willdenowi TaxID=441366 RepID=UPI00105642D1|nr:C-type lectin domain family 4 member M-like isoform X2 [Gouania willdenowi]